MAVELGVPTTDELEGLLLAVGGWQHDGGPVQLHPGDIGWHGRFGAETTARTLRTWRHNGALVAVGLMDGTDLVRLALAPGDADEAEVVGQMVRDLTGGGANGPGVRCVEVRSGPALRAGLLAAGWELDEPWTPLERDLRVAPTVPPGLRIEAITADRAADQVQVLRSAFEKSTFSAERWQAMAATPGFERARVLVGYDAETPVATAIVWSAGPDRPGLLEPVGVHRDHQGQGHGKTITLAAAEALRAIGASKATVCTPASNKAAVLTYSAAGFEEHEEVRDLRNPR